MEPLDAYESVSADGTDDENFDKGSTVEASLEILYGKECDDDTNTVQEKIFNTINDTLYEGNVTVDIVQSSDDSSDDDEEDNKRESEENLEELEIKIQNSIENLSGELNKAAEVIKEEKEHIEKELLCYKELREAFDQMCKDYEHTPMIKPKLYHQDLPKHARQLENFRHAISPLNMPVKSSTEFSASSVSTVNPWFYSKCLLDAEKFCDQQMERVRKCISVSSITSHAVGAASQSTIQCIADPSRDTCRYAVGDSSERHDSINSNQNTFSWRQQPLNSKGLDKRFMGSLEKGDSYNVDPSYYIHQTPSSIISHQISYSSKAFASTLGSG